ncbi:type II toxin-antitoxin system VapC family toxin [Corynebacterium aquatimens]|uniref:type II toxin-antitoxin system VapC family toxin n=1 Tax=Corynebacterium aquatimens TaxID=1190508 RepID=UPI0018CA7674|nr:type II toxin-antitoxin system VapC family toxin [Corynebacterium aquatimens]
MIVDANVLIYAVAEDSAHHRAALRWLEDALNGPQRVGFPWLSLLAFQRILTNPRIQSSPLSAAEASDYIDLWLRQDNAWVPQPGNGHAAILRRLTVESKAVGNLVPDAHLAALAVEYGTSVVSFDRDFAKFEGVTWLNPLEDA